MSSKTIESINFTCCLNVYVFSQNVGNSKTSLQKGEKSEQWFLNLLNWKESNTLLKTKQTKKCHVHKTMKKSFSHVV